MPLASVAWAVARTASPGEHGNSKVVLPGGYDLFFPTDTVVVAGVRYLGSVQVRADAFTRTPEDAQRISDQLSALLAVARTIEVRAQSTDPDPDLKAFFDSITVSQLPDRAELNASIPAGFLKKLVSEAPSTPSLSLAPAPEGKAPMRKGTGRKKR